MGLHCHMTKSYKAVDTLPPPQTKILATPLDGGRGGEGRGGEDWSSGLEESWWGWFERRSGERIEL